MEEYPLVKVKGRKVRRGDEVYRGRKAIEFINELGKKYGRVYVMDVDGYKKNSPNLSFYKKVDASIWIDSFPRYVEDVMDLIVSGFERITLWDMKEEYLAEIKDMCEVEIFIGDIEAEEAKRKALEYGFTGIMMEKDQKSSGIEAWKIYTDEWMVRRLE